MHNAYKYKYQAQCVSVVKFEQKRIGKVTKKNSWQRRDSNPRLRRDWCLKPAPQTARPRYLLDSMIIFSILEKWPNSFHFIEFENESFRLKYCKTVSNRGQQIGRRLPICCPPFDTVNHHCENVKTREIHLLI